MKIGIYNPRVGTKSAGGTETFLRQFISRCDESIELFTGKGELLDEIKTADVTCHQIPARYKEDRINELVTRYTPALAAEIESVSMFASAIRTGALDQLQECDVVSTHYYADNLFVSRFVDVPHIFKFPGIKQPSIRWRAMFAVDDTDVYVANSESTAARMAKWFNIDAAEIVYPGVDVKQFTPSERSYSENFVVLFVGRLDEGKGVPDLIKAVEDMDILLRIIGDGNRQSDFEALARKRLEPDSYEFVGEVPHDSIPSEYRKADVFCLPSYHESFGLVVLEALACGIPTVTTKLDAITEYIDHGDNGLLFEPGDVTKLAYHIRRLHDSPALRDRLSTNGRETAHQYSWETQIEKMITVYKQLAAQNE